MCLREGFLVSSHQQVPSAQSCPFLFSGSHFILQHPDCLDSLFCCLMFSCLCFCLPSIPLSPAPLSWLGHPHLLKPSVLVLTPHSPTDTCCYLLSARCGCHLPPPSLAALLGALWRNSVKHRLWIPQTCCQSLSASISAPVRWGPALRLVARLK